MSIPGGVTHAGSGGLLRVALFWSSNNKTSETYDTNTQVSRVHLLAQIVVFLWEKKEIREDIMDLIIDVLISCRYVYATNIHRLIMHDYPQQNIIGGLLEGASKCFKKRMERREQTAFRISKMNTKIEI